MSFTELQKLVIGGGGVRSDLLEKRRALMDAWAVYLVGAEVSPLKQVV